MPFTESPVRSEARQPSPLAIAYKTNPRPRLSHGGALVKGQRVQPLRTMPTAGERSGDPGTGVPRNPRNRSSNVG